MDFKWPRKYTSQDLKTPIFSTQAKWFWKILSVFLIPVNIIIMLYMFSLINVPGEVPVANWQRGLWLSQYIGLFCCYLCLTEFKNEDLNGVYAFVFLFPHIAFFQSIGNIFTFLNHFPHFLGWYVLFNPKIKFSRRGIYWGFGCIMMWLLLCFILQYPDGMGANANNISDELFPIILLGGLIWCGIVDRLWRRKQIQIAEICHIPQEKWVTEWQSWMRFSIEIIPKEIISKSKYYLVGGVILGSYFYMIFQSWNRLSIGIWIQMLSVSWIFLLLLLIGWLWGYKIREINGILIGLLLPTVIDAVLFVFSQNILSGLLIILNIIIFSSYLRDVQIKTHKKFIQFVNPTAILVGVFIQGIIYLLTASFSYHQGWMNLNINLIQTGYPLIFLIINGIIWLYVIQKRLLPNTH
jgi:thiamine transporter ThiT